MMEHRITDWTSRWLRGLVALGSLLALAATAADSIPNGDCFQCHGDKELTKTNAAGQAVSLFVDENRFTASRHGTNTCAGCHTDVGSGHPDDGVPVKPVTCTQCHQESSESYGASAHGRAVHNGQTAAATCKDCHGAHNILPHASPDSPCIPWRNSRPAASAIPRRPPACATACMGGR
jgi:hypothetical protein